MADADIPTPEAPVQDTPPADGGGGGDWLDSVPESYRDAGFVTKYKSQDEFFKGMDNLSRMAGQRPQGLVPPGEGASEDEVAAFRAGLAELSGVPGSLDEYVAALNLPELGEGAMMPKFVEMAYGQKVPPQALQGLISGLGQQLAAEEEAAYKAWDAEVKKNMDALEGEWGDEFDYRKNVAERFASELSKETLQMLEDARWTEQAPLVRDLYNLGAKYLAEGDLAQVPKIGTGTDIPNMNTLVAMKGDPRYRDPDMRDDNYVQQVHEYAKRLTEHQRENN
ncbi:hypothetical protein ACR42D_09995 [Desulfovibrio caledoniensis]